MFPPSRPELHFDKPVCDELSQIKQLFYYSPSSNKVKRETNNTDIEMTISVDKHIAEARAALKLRLGSLDESATC